MATNIDPKVGMDGEESSKALKYKKEVGEVTAELNRLKNQLADTEKGLNNVRDGLDDAGQSAISFGDLIKANVNDKALADGAKKLASSVKDMTGDLISAAADMKNQTAQFEQTFGDLKEKAIRNLEEIGEAVGILPNRMKSAYTQLYAYAKSSGMESAAALEFATKATYAAADAAAYYDRSLEEATEQVLAYTKGNFAKGEALGFASTEATRNAQAIKSLGKEYKNLDVTAGETTQVLLDQIIASQELSGAAGKASREMDGWENATGNLSEAWKEFKATAGAPLLENLVPLIQKGTEYLSDLGKSIDWNSFSQEVEKAFSKVEDFAEGAMDFGKKVLPVVGDGLKFVGDNFTNLASVAIGAYTALKVFQGVSAVSKVVTEFSKTLQTASTAMTVAQKGMQLLNLAMSANVFGAVAIAAATLVAGIAALVAIEEQEKTAAEEEAEAAKKVAEASRERLEAYQERIDMAEQQAIADTQQIAYTQELWGELRKLADETGNVQEKDKARAEFILGELNSALGTEYEMTGNQIQNYQDMTAAIDELIDKKRAQVLLDSHEEAYREAITNRTKLEKEQVQIVGELAEAREELSKKEEEYAKVQEELIRQSEGGTRNVDAALEARAVSLAKEVRALKENAEAKEAIYNDNETRLREYYGEMKKYEEGQALILAGENQKAIDLLDGLGKTLVLAKDLINKSHEEQVQILKKQSEDAWTEFDLVYQRYLDGAAGVTADMLLEAKKTAEAATAEWKKVGSEMVAGTVEGVNEKREALNGAIRSLMDVSVNIARQAIDAHSPSRRFGAEVGETIPTGIASGIDRNAQILNQSLQSMMDDSVDQMKNVGTDAFTWGQDMIQGFTSGINHMAGSLISTVKNIAGQVADFLGFSVPKKGPLSDADEYGPDFMKLFAQGIQSKSYLVQNAVGYVASKMDLPGSIMNRVPAGMQGGNSTTNLGGINIQVYGAEGQDVNELADIIMYKTQSAVERREAVFG